MIFSLYFPHIKDYNGLKAYDFSWQGASYWCIWNVTCKEKWVLYADFMTD